MEEKNKNLENQDSSNFNKDLVPFNKENNELETPKFIISEEFLKSLTGDNKVEQTKNNVGGDLIGRDKIVNNINVVKDKSTYLKNLYEKFALEEKTNQQFKAFIEELDYYNSQIGNETVVGLESKLIAGNRANIIDYAVNAKERFHKKLMATSQFSEVAQKINVYLLAAVRSYYILEIYPRICNNEDPIIINSLISEKIINPLIIELGDNLFDFTHEDVQGMLYFLTGNCHIKWTA